MKNLCPVLFIRYNHGMNKKERLCGILCHPTSFPSPYGVGDIGENAFEFVSVLAENHIRLWQILPLGPTGFGDSPYAARSTFAGNELLISIKNLYIAGYLELEDILSVDEVKSERVDYGKAKSVKMPLLHKAASNFIANEAKESEAYSAFLKKNSWWLDDYALFQVLQDKFNDTRWYSKWPEELKRRDADAIEEAVATYKDEIEIWKVLQFFFYSQWERLKHHANSNGISIIGDIPIFVAPDSVDAWVNTKLLKFSPSLKQETSSGVPPDAFSPTGQLWGNPTYRWSEHEKDKFSWWVKRLSQAFTLTDIVRIDHFRGFSACWEVPITEKTAENGKWVKGPGAKLFRRFREVFGEDLPIIAEDLGVITPDVEKLRDENGFPGMKILEFSFSFKEDGSFDAGNAYLPHNIDYNSVVYTGTHDNDTLVGWYDSLDEGYKDLVRRYFEAPDDQIAWKMIRSALLSRAKYAIFPMQDILMLPSSARMNIPSTCGPSNWSWRMSKEDIHSPNFTHLAYLMKFAGRD